jgi:UDP-glucose 4-epimerase
MNETETWVITGGAGYIGSHIVSEFLRDGKQVVVYDSLFSGLKSRIDFLSRKYNQRIEIVQADIRNSQKFEHCIEQYQPKGVVHSAALKSVEKSVENPLEYMEVNFLATREILQSLSKLDVHNVIFSSTAAVYGSPNHSGFISEADEKTPVSPYGESKLLAELEIEKFSSIPGNTGINLRFFNVVGAESIELEDNSKDNLVPRVLERLALGLPPIVFGIDYPTKDGTCIRDYVDVRDIARAHLNVANCKYNLPPALNIGTNRGVSVLEVIDHIKMLTKTCHISTITHDRRPGDPVELVADTELAFKTLGFKTKFQLLESIKSIVV